MEQSQPARSPWFTRGWVALLVVAGLAGATSGLVRLGGALSTAAQGDGLRLAGGLAAALVVVAGLTVAVVRLFAPRVARSV